MIYFSFLLISFFFKEYSQRNYQDIKGIKKLTFFSEYLLIENVFNLTFGLIDMSVEHNILS